MYFSFQFHILVDNLFCCADQYLLLVLDNLHNLSHFLFLQQAKSVPIISTE